MELVTFAEHASTLVEWKRRGIRGRSVVYLDAHLDFQQIEGPKIRRLAATEDLEAFEALQRRVFLDESDEQCYSFENYLYAAMSLGMVLEIVWIYPPTSAWLAEQNQRYLQSLFPNSHMEERDGTCRLILESGELVFCPSDRWRELEVAPDSLLDFDLDYFVHMGEHRVVADPVETVAALRSLGLTPDFVTLALSASTGCLPRPYLFLEDYVKELLAGLPGREPLRRNQLFDLLLAADAAKAEGDFGRASKLLEEAIRRRPDLAAAYALKAEILRSAGGADGDSEIEELVKRAGELDARFRVTPLERAFALFNRQDPFRSEDLRRLWGELEGHRENGHREIVEYLFGLLYLAVDDLEGALAAELRCQRHGREYPRLTAGIAMLLVGKGRRDEAIPWLDRALASRRAPTSVLASCHQKRGTLSFYSGRLDRARTDLEKAAALQPASLETWRHLALTYRKLGETEKYKTAVARCRQGRSRTHRR